MYATAKLLTMEPHHYLFLVAKIRTVQHNVRYSYYQISCSITVVND